MKILPTLLLFALLTTCEAFAQRSIVIVNTNALLLTPSPAAFADANGLVTSSNLSAALSNSTVAARNGAAHALTADGTFSGTFSGDASAATFLTTNAVGTFYGQNELAGNFAYAQYSYGACFVDYVTNTMVVNNLACALGGNGSNVTATLRLYLRTNLSPFNVHDLSNAPFYASPVDIPAWKGNSAASIVNFALPNLTVPAGKYLFATFEVAATNTLYFAFWALSNENTTRPRLPYFFIANSGGSMGYNGPNYYWGSAAVELTGPPLVVTNTLQSLVSTEPVPAAAITFDPSASGLPDNLQAAIDSLSVPSDPRKTAVVIDGDSKAVALGSALTNLPWWNSVAFFTNAAVGGIGLSDVVKHWNTNTSLLSARIGKGTNGIYVLWIGHNEYLANPYSIINSLSNYVSQVTSAGWNVVLLTVQPRASYVQDTHLGHAFTPIVNNWIRNSSLPWRVVDAESMMPNCYDSTFFQDTTHLTPLGNSLIASAVTREVFSRHRYVPPQEWVVPFGTNLVFAVPGSNAPAAVVGTWNQSGLNLSTNNWPAFAQTPGGAALVNSNGTVFLLTASPGSTNWAATNKLGGL